MKANAEFQKHNPFRRPDWRFDRVLALADRYPTPGRCSRRDDEYVRRARAFVLRWRAGRTDEERERLFWEEPGLYYAYQIHDRATEEPAAALFLQARLLARQTYEAIAVTAGTTVEAVAWYEALFFNVVDHLEAHDWVVRNVLTPAYLRAHRPGDPPEDNLGVVARPFVDASLKLFAYFGGAQLVDFLISGFERGRPVMSADDVGQWLGQVVKMNLRRRGAQASALFQVNKYNVMQLFEQNAKLLELELGAQAQQAKTTIEANLLAFFDGLGAVWRVGNRPSPAAATKPAQRLVEYDRAAAELSDDELLAVAAGRQGAAVADTVKLTMPPPRRVREAAPPARKEGE